MILSINIKNLALIDDINISLGKGLNIFTGDTGAGKTIILKAISGIFGSEMQKGLITHGKEEMTIDAEILVTKEKKKKIYDISGIKSTDDVYIISRTFLLNGRNSNRLNGRVISIDTLNEIGNILFDIHNQDETKNLLKKEKQLKLLDAFCDSEFIGVLEEYNKLVETYKNKITILKKIESQDRDVEIRKDILKYQINDIESLGLKKNEYNNLINKKNILVNSEKIISSLNEADQILSGEKSSAMKGAVDRIKQASNIISSISKYNEKYNEVSSSLEKYYWELKDIAQNISTEAIETDFSTSELDQIIKRIDDIDKIRKKYGSDYEEIYEFLTKCKNELETLNSSEKRIDELNSEIYELKKQIEEKNSILLQYRKKAANTVSKEVKKELKDLEMDKLSFEIDFKNKEKTSFQKNGNHDVMFLISPNPGHPVKPLEEISSGGEMARVMIVFKKLISNIDNTDIIAFDEIESGVSGAIAFKVGEKIKHISKFHQVICITHTPQLAAFSDNHYYVDKVKNNDRTYTRVEKLNKDKKIQHIAKLLGGNKISKNAFNNAKELILNADKSQ